MKVVYFSNGIKWTRYSKKKNNTKWIKNEGSKDNNSDANNFTDTVSKKR